MKIPSSKNWLKVLAIALSLPSSILFAAYILFSLVDEKIISSFWAIFILIAIVINSFVMMVIYAKRNKN